MSEMEEEMESCKLAEQAERYDDMATIVKKIVESKDELTNEERNLFSVAYKNLIGSRRASWRIISSIEQKHDGSVQRQHMIREYREKIEKELKDITLEVLTLVDKLLIPKAITVEAKLFYLRMMRDFYRYLAEVATGDERQKMIDKTHAYDNDVFDIIRNQLQPTDPIRLGLALSHSVFCFEILNEPDRACRLAKQAFDDAISELDTLNEESYKESTLIMQLLRDNLTLWTQDASDVDVNSSSEGQQ